MLVLQLFSLLALVGNVLAAPAALAPAALPTPATSNDTPSDMASLDSKEVGLDRAIKGAYSGDATYYDPGLGACGHTNTGSQYIVAVSHKVFDSYPGAVASNPNKNPICGKKLKATYGGHSVTLTVVDRCPGCQPDDLDMTRAGFKTLAPLDKGRIGSVKWTWV
ncbi:DPBB-1 domain-containing protein [Mycena kentingensis (nom. inval.)]|nr:DPBB-1 domain-containing protein [Mycena kentingensis (nom. inval.)]